ncbi:MAG: hypothetical protein KDC24_14205, partial [Saprospiraceae bacterium]|nr:hypothetical protein [Saprospiraceae bacterium]
MAKFSLARLLAVVFPFQVKIPSILTVLFLVLLLIPHFAAAQNTNVDSLQMELETVRDPQKKAEICLDLSIQYRNSDPTKGIAFGREALQYAKEGNWVEGEARAHFSIGTSQQLAAEYPESLKSYLTALEKAEKLQDERLQAQCLGGIAIVYRKTEDYKKTLFYATKSLQLNKQLEAKGEEIQNYNEIAIAHAEMGNINESVENFRRAAEVSKEINNLKFAAVIIGNIGMIEKRAGNNRKAIESFKESGDLHRQIDFEMGVGLSEQNIADVYYQAYLDTTAVSSGVATSRQAALEKALFHFQRSIGPFRNFSSLADLAYSLNKIAEIQAKNGNYESAYENYKEFKQIRDSISSNDDKVKLAKLGEERAELEKLEQEKLTQKQLEINTLINQKRKWEITLFIFGFLAVISFTLVVIRSRRKSEQLLLNILPKEVASELKKNGHSEARMFEDVTVLFSDFVGFTKVAERLSPQALVTELDTCFRAFDEIVTRYNIEKIKTIGDAYMAVSGLPK